MCIRDRFYDGDGRNTRFNVSFLRTKGIAKGVRFKFEGMFSTEQIEGLSASVSHMVKFLYARYISSIEIEVSGKTA
jgi:hypothetical protein